MSTPAELFASVGDAMKASDEAALRRLYAQDVEFEDPISGPLAGVDAVVPYLIRVVAPFTNLTMDFLRIVDDGPNVAIVWRQAGDLDSGPLVVLGSAFITAENDQITRQRDYFTLPPRTARS
jgi:ketosteroid isomerase-like protein